MRGGEQPLSRGAATLAPVDRARALWIGAGVAVGASLLLTVLAASLESSINGPGVRNVAPPVLWGVGGGAGLVAGAVVTAWLARRAGPGVLAALLGAAPLLALVVIAYNSDELSVSDKIVGTLIVVVLPAFLAAVAFAFGSAFVARMSLRPRRPLARGQRSSATS